MRIARVVYLDNNFITEYSSNLTRVSLTSTEFNPLPPPWRVEKQTVKQPCSTIAVATEDKYAIFGSKCSRRNVAHWLQKMSIK